jgi:hypothetical protein
VLVARLLLAFLLLAVVLAVGQERAASQQPAGWYTYLGSGQNPLMDPFYISPVTPAPYGPNGYTQASCTLGAGTNKVIVVMGQSLAMNTANDSYSVANPTTNLTFSPYNGNCYQTQYTMVATAANAAYGDCCGSYLARLGDNLINNDSVSKVIIIPPIDQQLTGSLIANWASPTVAPYLINNLAVVGRRLAAAGLTPTELVWELGTSDASAGTSGASFAANLRLIVAAFRNVWPTTPLLINTESFYNGSANMGIQQAQASVIDNVTIFAGANTDTIGNSGRYATSSPYPAAPPTHFNATGAAAAASLLESAIVAH